MEKPAKHILVVEDDDLMRDELSHTFAKNGYGVSIAKTGDEALEAALEKHPDLIVLDILMPKMGGLEMLKRLRTDPQGKDIPVLVLSNIKDEKTLAEAIEMGGYDYLLKADWTLEDVLEKVKSKVSPTEPH